MGQKTGVAVFRFLNNRQAARACRVKDLPRLVQALARGADPDAVGGRCKRGYHGKHEHLIHIAVEQAWANGVDALLNAGANPELRGGIHRATAFFLACEQQREAVMEVLAAHGADPKGLGWAVDEKALDEAMELLGWDYPSQASLVQGREMTAEEIVEYRRNRDQLAILAKARDRHAAKQDLAALEQNTAAAPGKSKALRL